MRVRTQVTGLSKFTRMFGILGFMTADKPDEPTPDTLTNLSDLATARRAIKPLLVGIYNGYWVTIEDYIELIDSYTVAQIDTQDEPMFMSDFTEGFTHYRGIVSKEELKQGLACLFIFDPLVNCVTAGGCRP